MTGFKWTFLFAFIFLVEYKNTNPGYQTNEEWESSQIVYGMAIRFSPSLPLKKLLKVLTALIFNSKNKKFLNFIKINWELFFNIAWNWFFISKIHHLLSIFFWKKVRRRRHVKLISYLTSQHFSFAGNTQQNEYTKWIFIFPEFCCILYILGIYYLLFFQRYMSMNWISRFL